MRKVTICFLLRENEICLAMKKKGFGEGKYNGVGGKQAEGETIAQTALREMEEEIGVVGEIEDLQHAGTITFLYAEKPEWDQEAHVYLLRKWTGTPTETDEMKPAWFHLDAIPYDKTWVDDRYWLPPVLAGKKIQAKCEFNPDGTILDFTLEEI